MTVKVIINLAIIASAAIVASASDSSESTVTNITNTSTRPNSSSDSSDSSNPVLMSSDLSGCGIYRECPSCSNTYGCTWNPVSGCTAGFGTTVCPSVPTPGSSKPVCEAYTDCNSCTTQAGCVFYQGQCTYSRGTGCQNDPYNCINYPSQCPHNPYNPSSFCNAYTPCPSGQTCNYNSRTCVANNPNPSPYPNPYPYQTCGHISQCPQGFNCTYNRCVPANNVWGGYCNADTSCSYGQICNLNTSTCVNQCYSNYQCPAHQYCNTSTNLCNNLYGSN